MKKIRNIFLRIAHKTIRLLRLNDSSDAQKPAGFDFFMQHLTIDENAFHKKVEDANAGNLKLKELILSNKPFMASRFGNTELWVCCNYLYNQFPGGGWNLYVKNCMLKSKSLWPDSEQSVDEFSEEWFKAIPNIDLLGTWNNRGEEIMTRFFCRSAFLTKLRALEPFFYDEPWSAALYKKKVLVIHPYFESITQQFHNRSKLFEDQSILPDFELITYRPFHVHTDDLGRYKNWNEALYDMHREISLIDFDIALIGAGHFGLPLASFIKVSLGKQAIHIGGSLQLLFGIKGKRWENRDHSKLFNEYWVYPNENETPPEEIRNKLDGGDYWK
jgi:hypothetical protein